MCWYLPKGGLIWASLVRQLMIWVTSFRPLPLVNGMSTASMTACYDSLDCLLGIPITQLSRTKSKGWVGMWDGYQMSRLTLHYSELEQLLAALLVLQISDLWCFASAAVDGLCSPQHSATQLNQLIKCNVAMHSTASAKHLIQTLFICFEVLDKVELSDLICN